MNAVSSSALTAVFVAMFLGTPLTLTTGPGGDCERAVSLPNELSSS
jgi:hypothetical protein